MSDTEKQGKRSRRVRSGEDKDILGAIKKRHIFGSTEKILRRNRKIWTRLAAKMRRRLDKEALTESALGDPAAGDLEQYLEGLLDIPEEVGNA